MADILSPELWLQPSVLREWGHEGESEFHFKPTGVLLGGASNLSEPDRK